MYRKKTKNKPLRILTKILGYFSRYIHEPFMTGDFEEEFNEIAGNKGTLKANLWYLLQILISILPFIKNSIYSSTAMFKNYIKIAFRNLKKQKGFTFINISGLALGMACCILVILWYQHELEFNNFHKNKDRIFRVNINDLRKDNPRTHQWTPFPLSTHLKEQYPEIINSTKFWFSDFTVRHNNQSYYEPDFNFVDPSFFEIFSFPVLWGNPENLMPDKNSIVISDEIKTKYFGDEDPIGKVFILDNHADFIVTGVIHIPLNSDIQGKFYLPNESLPKFNESLEELQSNWSGKNFQTIILLDQNASAQNVEDKIKKLLYQYNPDQEDLLLQSLSTIHLYYPDGSSDILKNLGLSAITIIFILIIACINFMNLSTARSEKRAKEVGLRKTIGAKRTQIIKQFLIESAILSFFSFILGLILIQIFIPVFNNITEKHIYFSLSKPLLVSGLFGSVFLICLMSGIYPSLFLSSFKPIAVLKGINRTGRSRGTSIRKILVITQFSFSILLIICTLIVYTQLKYVSNKKLGFNKDKLFYIRMDGETRDSWDVLKKELLKNPEIASVSAVTTVPPNVYWAGEQDWEGRDPENMTMFAWTVVDLDYVKTLSLKIKMGRDFSREFTNDHQNFLINEEAARQMGLDDPVGKELVFWRTRRGKIVGVVEDYHFHYLKRQIEPLIILASKDWRKKFLVIRYNTDNPTDAIKYTENTWNRLNPNFPFNYNFVDRDFEAIYNNETRLGKILLSFSFIAIFISCLGLFGLTAYLVEQRTKEIGVRKVLGASVSRIIMILTRELVVWVVISGFIALPLGYIFMNKWLQDFAYKADIGWMSFILSGLLAVLIALLTVSYQTIKCASADPADSLKI
ncbi:ABC transporter permease [candidate division KSB1 bacterium]